MDIPKKKITISVVSPVYKAELIVDELVRRIKLSLEQLTSDFEIILVDDRGPDKSWEKILANCEADSRVKGVKLSRNFGQHHAITAGLDIASGEWTVVMDCDLQDQPEEIIKLYKTAMEGYDIVFAQRENRQDSYIKKLSSTAFYRVFSYLSGIKQDGTIANFGIYHKKVIEAICTMREPMRGFTPMARWVGFNKTAVSVDHASRFEGKTSYSWSKLIMLALDIALSYSDKPLKLIVKCGFFISIMSFLLALYYLISYFTGKITVPGYASSIVSLWFLSGLIILTLGIIGLYISKIFDSVKNRPIYIVDTKVNL